MTKEIKWTGPRVDLIFGFALSASSLAESMRARLKGKICERLHQGVDQSHEPTTASTSLILAITFKQGPSPEGEGLA
jgi:hypothetical protein